MEQQEHVELLRKSGLKVTPQRLSVMNVIMEAGEHFKAEEVYKKIKRTEPSITLATVYNIFRSLNDNGIINSFEVDGTTWFESNLDAHANLFCEKCGTIEDVSIPENSSLLEQFSLDGRKVRSASFVLKGLCARCSKNSK